MLLVQKLAAHLMAFIVSVKKSVTKSFFGLFLIVLSWCHAAACGFKSPDSLPLASTVCSNTTTHLGHSSLTFTSSKLRRKAVPLAKYTHTNKKFQNPPGAEIIFTREHHDPDSLCMQRVNTP